MSRPIFLALLLAGLFVSKSSLANDGTAASCYQKRINFEVAYVRFPNLSSCPLVTSYPSYNEDCEVKQGTGFQCTYDQHGVLTGYPYEFSGCLASNPNCNSDDGGGDDNDPEDPEEPNLPPEPSYEIPHFASLRSHAYFGSGFIRDLTNSLYSMYLLNRDTASDARQQAFQNQLHRDSTEINFTETRNLIANSFNSLESQMEFSNDHATANYNLNREMRDMLQTEFALLGNSSSVGRNEATSNYLALARQMGSMQGSISSDIWSAASSTSSSINSLYSSIDYARSNTNSQIWESFSYTASMISGAKSDVMDGLEGISNTLQGTLQTNDTETHTKLTELITSVEAIETELKGNEFLTEIAQNTAALLEKTEEMHDMQSDNFIELINKIVPSQDVETHARLDDIKDYLAEITAKNEDDATVYHLTQLLNSSEDNADILRNILTAVHAVSTGGSGGTFSLDEETKQALLQNGIHTASIDSKLDGLGTSLDNLSGSLTSAADSMTSAANSLQGIGDFISEGQGQNNSPDICQGDDCWRSKSWVSAKYPEGVKTIYDAHAAMMENHSINRQLQQFAPNFGSGASTSWNFCIDFGVMGNMGCHELSIDPTLLAFIKTIILLTASFACRAIIFGG